MKDDIKFVSTKLKMPVPRKNYIRRDKILSKLEDVLDYKITLVIGAAASGKTTLVSSFIKEKAVKNTKWISLDKDNNNLFSFWYYFLESLKDYIGDQFNQIYDFFKSMVSNGDAEKLVTLIINSTDSKEDICIILDDFHNITDSNLLETIEYFIKYSSPNIHIILISREQPPIYLGDLLMDDNLLEINEEDLKFSSDEGIKFLKNTLNMNLKEEIVEKINSAAEGWVGGLQLIALTSNNSGIKDIKVLNKYMIDYLSNEILNSLNERERDFLIKTSILSYFNKDICNELLGISDAEDIINELLEKNLFLISIDEEEGIFRFHNIFGEFLKIQFEKLSKDIIEKVHLKAARIFEKLNDFDESISHLLSIKHYPEALDIIESLGENPKGWAFLSEIPNEYILEKKSILLQKLFHNFCNMELEQCKSLIEAASARKDYDDMKKIFEIFRGYIEDKCIEIDDLTFEEVDKLNISEVSKVITCLAAFSYSSISDNYEEINYLLNKAVDIENHYTDSYIRYYALSSKVQIQEVLGDLKEAENGYKQIFEIHNKYPILNKVRITTYIGIIGIYLKNYNLSKAEEYLENCSKTVYTNYFGIEIGYIYNLLEYKLLKGENGEVLQLSKRLLLFNKYREFSAYFPIMNFLMLSNNVNKEKLQKYIADYEIRTSHLVKEKLVYCRALIMLGEKEKAIPVLDEVLKVTRKYSVKTEIIQAILLKIQTINTNSTANINYDENMREVLNLLIEAVHYSYENEIIEYYILEKNNIKDYIIMLEREKSSYLNSKEQVFIKRVLSYMETNVKQEVLSQREKEVLQVLATGASNKEIGEQLCISVSTVKTHIINIYSKLGVSNRIEAVKKLPSNFFN